MNRQLDRAHSTAHPTSGVFLPLAIAVVLTGAIGCSTSIPGINLIPGTANPSEELTELGGEIQTARDSNVDVLAPTWFARAERSFQQARRLRDNGQAVQSILGSVAEGRAALEQARTLSAVSRESLPTLIRARDDARKAGAQSLSTYSDVEDNFLELTKAIEDDSLSWARKSAGKVEKRFRAVELDAIKRNTLDRIDDLIAKAKTEGAAELVPRVLKQTETRRTALESFIAANRYAVSETATRADQVLFEANRLVNITQRAKEAAASSPEQLALQNEALLQTLRAAVALPDARNQSATAQARSLESQLAQLKQERDELRATSDSQRTTIARLQGQNESERSRVAELEAGREFNERFAEVSDFFSQDEAEVYKKGDALVIRLRSLQFPSGSTVVLPESYPLMAKIQKAIRAFDEARVTIEGHTDSTGSTELNDHLSQSRADAVLAYLVSNETISDDRVAAVGKGFSEPLASDRTEEGRAQNRRIDVVIEPTSRGRQPATGVAAGPPKES